MTTFTTPTKHDHPAGAHFAEPRPRHRAVLARGSWRRVTRRIVCGLACALTVSSLLMPSISFAAEWVDVGGTQYNAGTAAGDAAGTWSWDGADDMKLNGYDGGAIQAEGKLNVSYSAITPSPTRTAVASWLWMVMPRTPSSTFKVMHLARST